MRKTGKKRPVSYLTGKSGTKRVFFAIDVPEQVIVNAERLIDEFNIPPAHVRWVQLNNLHITLKFLGDINTGTIPAIIDYAKKAVSGIGPIRLVFQSMGLFPNSNKPKVVWFGVGGHTDKLTKLESALSESLEPLGIPGDERAFTAHLTIGRVKTDNARGELIRLVHNNQKTFVGSALINNIVLYESSLNPGGSVYTKLATFDL